MSILTSFDGIIRPMFIETGTNYGESLWHAAKVFDSCRSVEFNHEIYLKACERFAEVGNVAIFEGHSPQVLPQIIDPEIPTTFWLDAHYFGNWDSATPYGQCPLARELEVIASRPWRVKPIVVIDDAHMFDDSIPHPGSKYPFWKSNESGHDMYKRSDWPKVEELDEIMKGYKRSMWIDHIMRYDDVSA